MDNTSLKVFMAAGDPDSAEYMANTIGTREVWKETKQIEGDITPESTGMGSLRITSYNVCYTKLLRYSVQAFTA